jgi:hypothetical protein
MAGHCKKKEANEKHLVPFLRTENPKKMSTAIADPKFRSARFFILFSSAHVFLLFSLHLFPLPPHMFCFTVSLSPNRASKGNSDQI